MRKGKKSHGDTHSCSQHGSSRGLVLLISRVDASITLESRQVTRCNRSFIVK